LASAASAENPVAEVVLAETRDRARWIWINRPERRNALNRAVTEGLIAALDAAEADPACRAIVLTGSGDRAFCAGADLERNADGAPFAADPAAPGNVIGALLARLERCQLPLLARINGAALAGGLGLVCACDLAVASETARFGTPEAKLGLFPMMILPHLLRVIPERPLLEMCLTGEPIQAQEALRIALVNYVVPADALDTKVDWLVQRIAATSPTALRVGRDALRAIRERSFAAGLDYAQRSIAQLAQTADAREGAAAFLEKRAPKWREPER
jgi:enoyl-CoA hydratase/carnithine racemase